MADWFHLILVEKRSQSLQRVRIISGASRGAGRYDAALGGGGRSAVHAAERVDVQLHGLERLPPFFLPSL